MIHDVVELITALAAAVAAVSSLLNRIQLQKVHVAAEDAKAEAVAARNVAQQTKNEIIRAVNGDHP